MRANCLAIALLCASLHANSAQGGAWTQRQGDALLIATTRIAKADEGFDAAGLRNERRDFEKKEVEAYLEYGLRNSLTLVLAPSFQKVEESGREETGLAYSDLGVRLRLYQGRYGVVSVQPLLVLPGTTGDSDNPLTGSGRLEEEMRLSVGRDFTLFGLKGFQDIAGAYRYRGEKRSQLRTDMVLGLNVTPRVQILAKSFTILGQDDFAMQKLQGSMAIAVNERWMLEAGYATTLTGRNVVAEQSTFLSLWFKY